jgi:acetolactate synthase regulatory subunit
MVSIRFEMVTLQKWARIAVHRSFSIKNLKNLLSTKFDCAFEHLNIRAYVISERPGGKLAKTEVSTAVPIQ